MRFCIPGWESSSEGSGSKSCKRRAGAELSFRPRGGTWGSQEVCGPERPRRGEVTLRAGCGLILRGQLPAGSFPSLAGAAGVGQRPGPPGSYCRGAGAGPARPAAPPMRAERLESTSPRLCSRPPAPLPSSVAKHFWELHVGDAAALFAAEEARCAEGPWKELRAAPPWGRLPVRPAALRILRSGGSSERQKTQLLPHNFPYGKQNKAAGNFRQGQRREPFLVGCGGRRRPGQCRPLSVPRLWDVLLNWVALLLGIHSPPPPSRRCSPPLPVPGGV